MFRILDQWLRLLFTGVALCLALEFMLRIFAPGNADTAWLFRMIHPVQPWLDTACYYLTQPVDKLGSLMQTYTPWLLHWIPATIKSMFPIMPAAVAAKNTAQWLLLFPHEPQGRFAQDIHSAPYGLLFPGVVDWRLMFALPLWNWAESIASGAICWVETQFYRQGLKHQDKQKVRQMMQSQQAQQQIHQGMQQELYSEVHQQVDWEPQNPKEQHAS